ncbi:MAG: hypothetical protein RBS40_06450 [Rhodocyclaceae bacterium]|jgi:Ni/Co efflux regulator RcnB|nr:hypothetical protein [Rhodocyclaceae bacterium]
MPRKTFAAALILASLTSPPVLADKPDWAGGGRHDKADRGGPGGRDDYREPRHDPGNRDERRRDGPGPGISLHFGDHQRGIARRYYHNEFSRGHCPPGLAKKGNGCLPPGQARRWTRGRPLPRDVVYYDLPPALVVELGVPPAGHRYVRVASDILLIAIGTSMVVDAIEDLNSR